MFRVREPGNRIEAGRGDHDVVEQVNLRRDRERVVLAQTHRERPGLHQPLSDHQAVSLPCASVGVDVAGAAPAPEVSGRSRVAVVIVWPPLTAGGTLRNRSARHPSRGTLIGGCACTEMDLIGLPVENDKPASSSTPRRRRASRMGESRAAGSCTPTTSTRRRCAAGPAGLYCRSVTSSPCASRRPTGGSSRSGSARRSAAPTKVRRGATYCRTRPDAEWAFYGYTHRGVRRGIAPSSDHHSLPECGRCVKLYAISCAMFRAAAPDPGSGEPKPTNPALARSEVAPDNQMPPFAVLEEGERVGHAEHHSVAVRVVGGGAPSASDGSAGRGVRGVETDAEPGTGPRVVRVLDVMATTSNGVGGGAEIPSGLDGHLLMRIAEDRENPK